MMRKKRAGSNLAEELGYLCRISSGRSLFPNLTLLAGDILHDSLEHSDNTDVHIIPAGRVKSGLQESLCLCLSFAL